MEKIIDLDTLNTLITNLKSAKKTIVLVGGCFDILHIGHIKFLQEAKKRGDVLIVLLENDERVKELKGKNRPIHSQKERAEILASLKFVDYIILLPYMKSSIDYDKLIFKIKPNIIAVTTNDPLLEKKKKQLEMVGGTLKVISPIPTSSTSKLVRLLGID